MRREVERYMEQVLAAADDLSDLPPPLLKRPSPPAPGSAAGPEPVPEAAATSAAERAADAAFAASEEAADAAKEAAVPDAVF